MIKFVSDLRQVGGFYPGSLVSSSNKFLCHDILLKVMLNTIKQTDNPLTLRSRFMYSECIMYHGENKLIFNEIMMRSALF